MQIEVTEEEEKGYLPPARATARQIPGIVAVDLQDELEAQTDGESESESEAESEAEAEGEADPLLEDIFSEDSDDSMTTVVVLEHTQPHETERPRPSSQASQAAPHSLTGKQLKRRACLPIYAPKVHHRKTTLSVRERIEKNMPRGPPRQTFSRFGWGKPPMSMPFSDAMAMMGLDVNGHDLNGSRGKQ